MALIQHFEQLEQSEGKLHLPVLAKLGTFTRDGKSFVQINTYGLPTREIPGKVSQSIQLNRDSARQLMQALSKVFAL